MGMRVSRWIRGRGSGDGGDESFFPVVVRTALMIMTTTIQRALRTVAIWGMIPLL